MIEDKKTKIDTPTLTTKRLVLEPLSLKHANDIQKNIENWNIIKNLSTAAPWPYPANGAENYIQNVVIPETNKGREMFWALTIKKSPEAIGILSFRLSKENKNGDRGFWLAEHHWGNGYITEAINKLNEFLLNKMNIESYKVENAIDNIRSRKVKERTGAKLIGYGELEHNSGCKKTEIWEIQLKMNK